MHLSLAVPSESVRLSKMSIPTESLHMKVFCKRCPGSSQIALLPVEMSDQEWFPGMAPGRLSQLSHGHCGDTLLNLPGLLQLPAGHC